MLKKGDEILFSPWKAGYKFYKKDYLIIRKVSYIGKLNLPVCSLHGFNQPIPMEAIVAFKSKKEWRGMVCNEH